DVESIQQNDEEELTTEERKRHRFMSELRVKKDRTLSSLENSGHTVTLLSGFAVPEIMSRWLDKPAWEEWKVSGIGWDENEDIEPEVEKMDESSDNHENEKRVPTLRFIRSFQKENTPLPKEIQNETEAYSSKIKEGHIMIEDTIAQSSEELSGAAVEEALEAIGTNASTKYKNALKSILASLKPKESWSNTLKNTKEKKLNKSEDSEKTTDDSPLILAPEVAEMKPTLFTKFKGFVQSLGKKGKIKPSEMLTEQIDTVLASTLVSNENKNEWIPPITDQFISNNVFVLTSTASTGKTFIGANASVALSTSGKKVTLIDLSPDRGTLTVLNPRIEENESTHWERWKSRQVPDLDILFPLEYPDVEEVIKCMKEKQQDGVVVLDLPWSYPDRQRLETEFGLIAVLDCDYHHWLQFESNNDTW
ncbi:hypothetical protein, partial [Mycobacterium tuberculosis]|uniref:hypothetical protein n=1 Tax=Mycobacterium tuberculosis TaxID=1773 RepID=UPI001587D1D3